MTGPYSWGYNDETCPQTSNYSAYNVVKAPKLLALQLETGHYTTPAQSAGIMDWIKEYLKTGKAAAVLIQEGSLPAGAQKS